MHIRVTQLLWAVPCKVILKLTRGYAGICVMCYVLTWKNQGLFPVCIWPAIPNQGFPDPWGPKQDFRGSKM